MLINRFVVCILVWVCCVFSSLANANQPNDTFLLGAERQDVYLPLLKNKNVGLIVNQSSRVNDLHLVDHLIANGICIKKIFAPEHGFRGNHDAGAKIKDGVDSKTGVPIVSIYGEFRKPPAETVKDIDVLLFDIQDVGLRFYTYISSMHYMMEVAAENNISFVVLDRPNPNGKYIDGPIREEAFTSFVGMHPIPVLHGMTVAELAQMIKGEKWINKANDLILHAVPMQSYSRTMSYSLPIKPSPNLPNDQSIQLYGSLCLFEPTAVSIGRGTDFPFQVAGHDVVAIGDFSFSPRSIAGAASNPKLLGKQLKGVDLREADISGFDLSLLFKTFNQFKQNEQPFFTSTSFFDKLAGTDKLRLQLEAGESWEDVKNSWASGLAAFKQQRAPYLLYE